MDISVFTGEMLTFEAVDSDPMLGEMLNAQCPAGQKLQLKKGAQVRSVSELDLVNPIFVI